jgi:hypothetical protein
MINHIFVLTYISFTRDNSNQTFMISETLNLTITFSKYKFKKIPYVAIFLLT